jgi:hypothetical protein
MAIKIVDLPIKNGDFPVRKLLVYQRDPEGKDLMITTTVCWLHTWFAGKFPSRYIKTHVSFFLVKTFH